MLKPLYSKNFYDLLMTFIILIIADQAAKIYVAQIMFENSFRDISISSFLNITFVRNTGISFGLFSDGGLLNRYFFTIFATLIGLTLFITAILSKKKFIQFSLVFISSGAIGNAIDRTYFGGVIDFIDFFIYNFHWPSFNLADVFITIGVISLFCENIVGKKHNV